MGAGNRVCIWGEILQEVSRKGGFCGGETVFFRGKKGVRGVIGSGSGQDAAAGWSGF